MAVTTVGAIIERAKRVLQEVTADGVRWTNSELIGWLNEAYIAVAVARPDSATVTDRVPLVEGARQRIPADGLRLVEVLASGKGGAVKPTTRRTLATLRPAWQAEPPAEPEFYLFDDLQPTEFWLYPPAAAGDELLVSYARAPVQHDAANPTGAWSQPVSVSDRYATALLDFVLYRAFAKDAETAANLGRSQTHYQAFSLAVGQKGQGDAMISPNGGADASR